MAIQKENINVNSWSASNDDHTTSIGSALVEITEKAAKVRNLLEKKQRDVEICNLISASSESLLINNIKKEIVKENNASFKRVADLIETKIHDLSEKNEKCINSNIERSIEASNKVIKMNSTEMIEKLLSNDSKNKNLNSLNESLVSLFLEHKDNIKDSLKEIVNTINNKESQISQEVCKFIREHDEKEKSVYLSQLNIIQKQYELIIRDLRRRNMFLQRDLESKQIREKKLYEQIKSMDIEAKEAVLVLEEKDYNINSLNSQLNQLKIENKELRDKYINLNNENQVIIMGYSDKFCSLKNKCLLLGIEFLHDTLESIISTRYKEVFNILKYYKFNYSNPEMSEDLSVAFEELKRHDFSTQMPIRINENNLFDLLDVEKRIKEQEKEQSLINSLLSIISGQNYTQITLFTKIIDRKRAEILSTAFSILKLE